MKSSLKILSGIVIIALIPMLAEAQRDGQSESQSQDRRMHDGDMGMMAEQYREHMEQMRALMQQLRQEEGPERRRELLQAHREHLHASMRIMNRGQNGEPGAAQSMEERMEQMQQRMDMMQGMLEQMMDNAEQAWHEH